MGRSVAMVSPVILAAMEKSAIPTDARQLPQSLSPPAGPRRLVALLCVGFVLSGATGVTYELVWTRWLMRLLGGSTPAVAGVVAIYFAGVAVGAILAGRWLAGTRSALATYGRIELGIGASAACVPLLLGAAEWLATGLAIPVDAWAIRLLLATLVLMVPATLIGATFPAMAATLSELRNATSRTALFYGVNTLGAVAGCGLAGFAAIPTWGLWATTGAAVSINGIIGVLALLAAGRLARRPGPEPVSETAKAPITEAPIDRPIRPSIGWTLAAVSGALAIAIEVLWTRALALAFPGSVYVFTVVLAAFLAGIGGGSLILRAAARRWRLRWRALAGAWAVCGLGGLAAMVLFPRLYGWCIDLLAGGHLPSWPWYMGAVSGLSLLAMLPATLAMGVALPLLIGAMSGRGDDTSVAGQVYGLNTLGGVLGSLVGVFVLMPELGLSAALLWLAVGYLVLASAVLLVTRQTVATRVLATTPLLACVVAVAVIGVPEVNGRKLRPRMKLLHYKDAPSGTVAVYEHRSGVRRLMLNNHYTLSATDPHTLSLQRRLGLLPLLLHPNPQRALLIGLATGTTLQAMAEAPVAELDCVELHPTLLQTTGYFVDPPGLRTLVRRGVRIQAADGRHFLGRAGADWDVIVGDLYLPRLAGVGAMFSREHFAAAKGRLADGGLFVSWVPLFQLAPEQLASVVRAFLDVFGEAEGYVGHWHHPAPVLGLVGWRDGARRRGRSDSAIEAALQQQGAGEQNTRGQSMRRPRQVLNTAMLAELAAGATANSLDLPLVEYGAPRALLNAGVQRRPLAGENLALLNRLLLAAGRPAW